MHERTSRVQTQTKAYIVSDNIDAMLTVLNWKNGEGRSANQAENPSEENPMATITNYNSSAVTKLDTVYAASCREHGHVKPIAPVVSVPASDLSG